MNARGWAVVGLLALLPNAAAESAPTSQLVSIVQTSNGIHVIEQLEWTVGSAYDPQAHFYTPISGTNLKVTLWSTDGLRRDLAAVDVTDVTGVPGFVAHRANLAKLQPNASASAKYSVAVSYDLPTTEATLRTWYAVNALAIFASARDNQRPASDYFGQFTAVRYDTMHAAKANVPANQTYDVKFMAVAPAGQTSDVNPYLWAAGGLLLGMLILYVAARQGWVNAPGRAKKFSKGGTMESRSMLEARRRTLLAALKELEQAHETKEVPDDAYAPLKEEYKAQAVRVMRSLEGKKEG